MRTLSRTAAFWSVAVLLVLVLAASGVPSPLYRVYAEEFGFGTGTLTLVFAVYAFALLAALLTVGALSDHVGRRPVLAVALLVEAVAMGLFFVADGVWWLLAARVVQGLATGAMTGAFGAALLDLQRRDRPLGPLINSASPGWACRWAPWVRPSPSRCWSTRASGCSASSVPCSWWPPSSCGWGCRSPRHGCPGRWPRCGPACTCRGPAGAPSSSSCPAWPPPGRWAGCTPRSGPRWSPASTAWRTTWRAGC
ncbi:MFS transporter [Klenkia terrae]|uniref:MFS transporter n=1 Tax=Klenkia terrae TaxID=1052259 RepID=UPI0036202F83